MGATHSTPKAKPKLLPPDGNAPDPLPQPILTDVDPNQTLQYDLNLLLKVIDAIPRASGCKPLSVFGQFSIPVITSTAKFDQNSELKLKFAKIAISRHEMGRIIAFGNISTIISCTADNPKHTLFIQKTLRWIGGPHPTTRMLCLYRIDPKYQRQLKTNLEGLGFGIDITDTIENIMNYTIVFVQSNCEDDPRFIDFITEGGGLFVVGVDDVNIPINGTLQKVGLSYFPQAIEFEDDELMDDINPKQPYEMLEKAKIDEHISVFKNVVNNNLQNDETFNFLSGIVMQETLASSSYSLKSVCDLGDLILPITLNVLQRDNNAELISNEGFSVVAPMRVILPCSTYGKKASCCALLKR